MSTTPIFRTIVIAISIMTVALAVLAGGIGLVFVELPGLIAGVLGAFVAGIAGSLTAISILIANRFHASDIFVPLFFGLVLGGWILKFLLFLVLVFALGSAPWLDRTVYGIAIIVGIVASTVIDLVVIAKSRIGYVSDVTLPHQSDIDK